MLDIRYLATCLWSHSAESQKSEPSRLWNQNATMSLEYLITKKLSKASINTIVQKKSFETTHSSSPLDLLWVLLHWRVHLLPFGVVRHLVTAADVRYLPPVLTLPLLHLHLCGRVVRHVALGHRIDLHRVLHSVHSLVALGHVRMVFVSRTRTGDR
jgi:hypothetical protein